MATTERLDPTCERCIYCQAVVPDADIVPPVYDDTAWGRLAPYHFADCEWVETRAHRVGHTTDW